MAEGHNINHKLNIAKRKKFNSLDTTPVSSINNERASIDLTIRKHAYNCLEFCINPEIKFIDQIDITTNANSRQYVYLRNSMYCYVFITACRLTLYVGMIRKKKPPLKQSFKNKLSRSGAHYCGMQVRELKARLEIALYSVLNRHLSVLVPAQKLARLSLMDQQHFLDSVDRISLVNSE